MISLKDTIARLENYESLDLINRNFSSEVLNSEDISNSFFEHVTFENMLFNNCKWDATRFFNCTFFNCTFDGVSFHKSEFHDSELNNCTWKGCVVTKAEFHTTAMTNSVMTNVNFDWSFFNGCDLRNNKLEKPSFKGSIISESKLFGTFDSKIDIDSEFPVSFHEIDMSELGDGTLIKENESMKQLLQKAELEEEVKQKIRKLIDQAYDAYTPESIDESVKILNEAWDLIPEDKSSWEEGYRVAHEFIETYASFGDMKEAEKWVKPYLKADEKFRNLGGGEFEAGKIAFELGKLDEAKKYFKIADEKSDGRLWKERKDTKYYKFYKE